MIEEYELLVEKDSFCIIKFNDETIIDRICYLYINHTNEQILKLPIHGNVNIVSASPSEIVMIREGYIDSADEYQSPSKITLVKIDDPSVDFWNGFHRNEINLWVPVGKNIMIGKTFNAITLPQISITNNSVQLYFIKNAALAGSPLQNIKFDKENGICMIQIPNCDSDSITISTIPQDSVIHGINYQVNESMLNLSIEYDVSQVDLYYIEKYETLNDTSSNGVNSARAITDIRFSSKMFIMPDNVFP